MGSDEPQLFVALSKSRCEFANQASALFKRSVELGCVARKTSALIGSGFGLTLINDGSFGRDAQALSKISVESSKALVMFSLGLTELIRDPGRLLPVTKLLLLNLFLKSQQFLRLLFLILQPQDTDILLARLHAL